MTNNSFLANNFYLVDYFIDKLGTEEPLMGVMKYSNDQLNELGVFNGDVICFQPESE